MITSSPLCFVPVIARRFFVPMLNTTAIFLAAFSSPTSAETLYVGESNQIVTISPAGVRSNFVSPGPALNNVYGMAFDKAGNLYAANYGLSTIEKIAGSGATSVFAAGLFNPAGMAFDAAGNLYVANTSNNTIYEYNSAGVKTVFASTPNQLNQPFGLAFDHGGNLYVSNRAGNFIEKYTPGGVGTVFAHTLMSHPIGLAFDAAGNLYVANEGDSTISVFNSAGVGSIFSTNDHSPFGLAFDSSGNLFASNESGNTIEKFDSSGVGSTYYHSTTDFSPYAIAFAPSTAAVPEPTSLVILAIGFLGQFCYKTVTARSRVKYEKR